VVTSYLVYTGVVLIWFVEPPLRWFAVIEPRTPDRKPALLAIGLGLAYAVVLAVPLFREFFSLASVSLSEGVLALIGVIAWTLTVRVTWRYRVIERFLGLPAAPEEPEGS
jgi:cation-transporting ATPase E